MRKVYPPKDVGSRLDRAAFASQAVILAQDCPSIRFIWKQALYDILCQPIFQAERVSSDVSSKSNPKTPSKSSSKSSRKLAAGYAGNVLADQQSIVELSPLYKDRLLKARIALQQTWRELWTSSACIGADPDLDTLPTNKCTCATDFSDGEFGDGVDEDEEYDEDEAEVEGNEDETGKEGQQDNGQTQEPQPPKEPQLNEGNKGGDGEDGEDDEDEEAESFEDRQERLRLRDVAKKQRMKALWFDTFTSPPSEAALKHLGELQREISSASRPIKKPRGSASASRKSATPLVNYGALSSLPSWKDKSIEEIGSFDIMLGLKLLIAEPWSELECQHCVRQRIKRWEKTANRVWKNLDNLFGLEGDDDEDEEEFIEIDDSSDDD